MDDVDLPRIHWEVEQTMGRVWHECLDCGFPPGVTKESRLRYISPRWTLLIDEALFDEFPGDEEVLVAQLKAALDDLEWHRTGEWTIWVELDDGSEFPVGLRYYDGFVIAHRSTTYQQHAQEPEAQGDPAAGRDQGI